MASLMKLANETLIQIIEDLHPEDILNFSLGCKDLGLLAQETLAQHRERQETYSDVILCGCHRHDDNPHPSTLIVEIYRDPRIAYFPRRLIIECCELFAGRRGDETKEYDEDCTYFSEPLPSLAAKLTPQCPQGLKKTNAMTVKPGGQMSQWRESL